MITYIIYIRPMIYVETFFGFESHELISHEKDYHFFKPFVISEIILWPYRINATDMMKLLFYHILVKYNSCMM